MTEFRREYSFFAQRNAHRLDVINAAYLSFVRRFTIAGVIVALMVLGLGVISVAASDKASIAVAQVQAGRRSLCRDVRRGVRHRRGGEKDHHRVHGSSPTAEERALEALGLPPFKIRLMQSRIAADGYVNAIVHQVNAQIGGKGNGLVLKGGAINCAVLEHLARVGPNPR